MSTPATKPASPWRLVYTSDRVTGRGAFGAGAFGAGPWGGDTAATVPVVWVPHVLEEVIRG